MECHSGDAETLDLTDQQALNLSFAAAFVQIQYIGVLVFLVYNTLRHFYRLKITDSLIVLFYGITFFQLVARVLETSYAIACPRGNLYDFKNPNWAVKCRSVAQCALCTLDVLLIVTMLQIVQSLRLILNEVDIRKAKTQRRAIYIAGIAFVIIYCSCVVLIYIHPWFTNDVFFTFAITYGILAVVYTVTIYVMLHTLGKLTDDGLKSQISSVKKQFIVFFAGFLIKTIFYYSEYYFQAKDDVNTYFVMTFVSWVICPCWNTIPIIFVLHKHHSTFKQQEASMTADLIEESDANTATEVSLRSLSTHGREDDVDPDFADRDQLKGSLIVASDEVIAPSSPGQGGASSLKVSTAGSLNNQLQLNQRKDGYETLEEPLNQSSVDDILVEDEAKKPVSAEQERRFEGRTMLMKSTQGRELRGVCQQKRVIYEY